MYAVWANGTGISLRSYGTLSGPMLAAMNAIVSWSNQAPFGMPVEPVVHTTTAASLADVAAQPVTGAAAPGRSRAAAGVRTGQRAISGTWSGASVTITAGSHWAMMCSVSVTPSRGLI